MVVVKVLKVLFVLVLVAGVGCGVWFGVVSAEQTAGAALPISPTLNYYPTDLVADGYTAEFQLSQFLAGTAMPWQKKSVTPEYGYSEEDVTYVADPHSLQGTWNAATKTYTPGNTTNAIKDAISLLMLASYNEVTIPYYNYYVDAGGNAAIGTALSGGLMVQATTIVNNGDEYSTAFKEQINALANVQASDFLIKTAKALPQLNKAVREATINNVFYKHAGSGASYVTDTPNANFPEIFPLDPGYCAANWDSVSGDESWDTFSFTRKDQSADAKWRQLYDTNTGAKKRSKTFGEMYRAKYELDLHDSNVMNWFKDASIEVVYTNEKGETSTTPTDHYYLKCSLTADLPEFPEGFDDMGEKEMESYVLENYATAKINTDGINNRILKQYTGASPVYWTKLVYEFNVWDIGIFKDWKTVEGWWGALVGMKSNVKPYSPTYYSYTKSESTAEVVKEYATKYVNSEIK